MENDQRLVKEIAISSDVKMTLKDNVLAVKGPKGELKRKFVHPRVTLNLKKDRVEVSSEKPRRFEKGLIGTWIAHTGNMQRGVISGFEYKMRIIFSHFPIKTSVKGSELVIENFLGERHPRRAKILEGVTAKISGDTVTLSGINKENV
ncbi:MAG: 50S ribosomal protein L6, partial [Candidatus Thermoplasmatota archaeon]|nr:50S ribosomal protein L6 [Candidatus Thermoplasmatota archaeon]